MSVSNAAISVLLRPQSRNQPFPDKSDGDNAIPYFYGQDPLIVNYCPIHLPVCSHKSSISSLSSVTPFIFLFSATFLRVFGFVLFHRPFHPVPQSVSISHPQCRDHNVILSLHHPR